MKFGEFIKEKILLIFLVLFIIASSEILLLPYPQIEIFVRLYIAICPVIIIGTDIVLEYRKKSNFYFGACQFFKKSCIFYIYLHL